MNNVKRINKFNCQFCDNVYTEKNALYEHMEKAHDAHLNNLPPSQVYFNHKYNKSGGKCIIDGKPTKWNESTEKYDRLCCDICREKYRAEFKKRMFDVHGKVHLLNNPEQQRKMLESRSISGTYESKSGYNHTYTGTYEHNFLEFLDLMMAFPPEDVFSPAPQTFYYKDKDGEDRFYIPDFLIMSLNLLIEIKSFDNKHYRERDKDLEPLKAEAGKKAGFNMLTVPDNNFSVFMNYLIDQKNKE